MSRRTETIVRERYAVGPKQRADKLRCPVDYKSEYLKVIPQEVTHNRRRGDVFGRASRFLIS